MKWMFIEANDVWMFRESRPFAAGQAFVARSVFPPYPQTMAGAIRTNILEQTGVDFKDYARRKVQPELIKAIGAPAGGDDYPAEIGSLRLMGPFVAQRQAGKVKRFFRAPLDLMRREGKTGIAAPVSVPNYETNLPFENWHPLSTPDQERGWKEIDGWLDDDGLIAYLQGRAPAQAYSNTDLFLTEEKIGLGINYDSRTAQESLLYHADFVRPLRTETSETGLAVGLDDLAFKLLPQGVLMLGGEGRAAYYEEIKTLPEMPRIKPGKVKVILTTPAYFAGGWQPENWSPWLGEKASLVSAAVGKPISISGWDLARGTPKPMRALVPAGSVYFFENAAVPTTPFTETPRGEADFGATGFGGFALANW